MRVYRPGYWLPLDVRGGTWRAGENTPKSIQLFPDFEVFLAILKEYQDFLRPI
jgi:hypothetical protein